MVNENLHLFKLIKQHYHPEKNPTLNSNFVEYFEYIGRLVGMALFSKNLMNVYLSHVFWKLVLEK